MTSRTCTRAGVAAGLLLGILWSAPRARAQDDGHVRDAVPTDRLGFTVHGKARGVADSVEVEFVVEASAEDATEAERLHRKKLKDVVRALDELRQALEGRPVEGASEKKADSDADADDSPRKKKKAQRPLEEAGDDDDAPPAKGADKAKATAPKKRRKAASEDEADGLQLPFEVREGRTIFGLSREDQTAKTPAQVTVATAVQIRMSGLSNVPRAALRKRLARIVDKAIEAGADSGGSDSGGPIGHGVRPAFRFKVKDNEALREAAYKAALDSGRERASRLARLCGREIEVLSNVRETGWQLRAGADDTGEGFDVIVGRIGNNKPNNHDLLVSTTECELEVQLALEFSLKAVTPEAAPAAAK